MQMLQTMTEDTSFSLASQTPNKERRGNDKIEAIYFTG